MIEWITHTFDLKSDLYEKLYVPGAKETAFETDFIVHFLELTFEDRLIDVCCGSGRHVVELYKRGYRIDGVDLSESLLKRARLQSSQFPTVSRPSFYREDCRNLAKANPSLLGYYTVALNLFSSFGYYEENYAQLEFLNGISFLLRKGGRFLLDMPNKSYVLENFQPKSQFTLGGLAVNVLRRFDTKLSRIYSTTSVSLPEGEEVFSL